VFGIVAVVTARRDPDPMGTRPYTVYLSLVLFVATFTALFASTAMVSSIVRIPLKEYASGFTGYAPLGRTGPLYAGPISGRLGSQLDRQHAAAAVQAALVVAAALAVLWFHVRRLRELVQEPRF